MRLTINLLPEDKKKEINNKKNLIMIINQSILFLLPIICFGLMLFVINIILSWNLEGQVKVFATEQSQGNYKKLKNYEEEFAQINSKIGILLKIQASHLYWSNILKNLTELVPENVYITGILNKDFKISVSGKAKTREDFLNFQNKISTSDCFDNVDTPLSNLVSKDNVVFQIDFDVKQECLIPENI